MIEITKNETTQNVTVPRALLELCKDLIKELDGYHTLDEKTACDIQVALGQLKVHLEKVHVDRQLKENENLIIERWEYANCYGNQLKTYGQEGWEAYAIAGAGTINSTHYLKRRI